MYCRRDHGASAGASDLQGESLADMYEILFSLCFFFFIIFSCYSAFLIQSSTPITITFNPAKEMTEQAACPAPSLGSQ